MAITSESEPRVPTDLRKVLAASAGAKAQWSDLTPIARRDFISWIETAKTTRDPQTPCREHPFEARLRQAAPLLLCTRAHESLQSHRLSSEGKGTMEGSYGERAQRFC